MDQKQQKEDLYPVLFSVDYGIEGKRGIVQGEDDEEEGEQPIVYDRYTADLSFSFFHWKLIEEISSGLLSIESVDPYQLKVLVYNILPDGQTFIHKVQSRADILEKIYEHA